MKKILIAFTIFLAMFTVNVGAETVCQGKLFTQGLTQSRVDFTITHLGSGHSQKVTGYFNWKKMGNPSSRSGESFAFCLDRTKMPGTKYKQSSEVIGIVYNSTVKKAFNFINGANIATNNGKMRYIMGQIIAWSAIEGWSINKTTIVNATAEAMQNVSGTKFISLETRRQIENLYDAYEGTPEFSGTLYVYDSTDGTNYQRMLSAYGGYCVTRTYCPSPNQGIEITDCISSGKTQAVCINEKCPVTTDNKYCPSPYNTIELTTCINEKKSSMSEEQAYESCKTELCPPTIEDPEPEIPACRGGVLKVVSDPAVCANDNQTHTGHYWQELDESGECGDADEDGEPVRPIGDGSVAWLYCKEEAYQHYPGGIANPVPVGTHIVWPTSTATLNTIWGNLYSLSYEGIKTCKIKFSPNTKSQEDMSLTFQAHIANINGTVGNINYVGELENIRTTLAARGKVNDKGLATEDACAYSGDGAYGDQQVKSQRELEDAKAKLNECTTVTNTVDQNSEGRNNCKVACAHTEHTPETYADCINYCDGAYPTNNVTTTTSTCTNNEKRQREALVNQKQNELNAINAKINVCDNYIKAYNGATEFLNNIVFAGKTNWNPSDLYFFESDTSISYTDDKYGTEYQLKLSGETFECEGCNSSEYVRQHSDVLKNYTVSDMPSRFGLEAKYNQIVRLIGDRPITITATATYSLPDDLYHYVDRRTNTPLNYPTDDYIKIGYSNLPISSTANVKEPYNLNIIVNSLGQDGKFTELANQNPYVCNYSVTNAPTDECICPDGTKHAGKDLYCKIYGSNSSSTTITCADAQILYCDSDETFDEVCTDDKFCPNDRSIKITSCLNNGKDYDYCVSTLCGIDEDFHCPSGTFNDGMDIKPCVFSYMSLGYSKDEAAQICKDTVCPYKGGVNIIYRTISLRNPFPGKTAGSGVSNTTNKFSLDPHIGRYPGSNWNSVRLVETQILKNRGVEGNAVYQKTPLYTFILDTNTIKEIRKYNESRENNEGYADFTLDCDTNGVACISKQFVRNEMYGIQKNESVCGSSQHSDFYACSES